MTQPARWLVFGVGNPSRGDDALGPLFVERLDAWAATAGDLSVALVTLTDFQWQIEHALDLADIDVVVFVDASVRAEPPFELAPRPLEVIVVAHKDHPPCWRPRRSSSH